MSRGFNVREYSDEYVYSRTPQVLKIQYNENEPSISIIKSSLKNTLIHVKDMDVNPYKGKYIKYKSKYLSLLNNYNEIIKKRIRNSLRGLALKIQRIDNIRSHVGIHGFFFFIFYLKNHGCIV
jgi:hypothetical protein